MLNKRLLKSQEVSKDQEKRLLELHEIMDLTLEGLEEADPSDYNQSELKVVNHMIASLEFEMQDNWNFERDEKLHTHWLRLDGCSCPQMDNKDPLYYGRGKIINGNCKWHGG